MENVKLVLKEGLPTKEDIISDEHVHKLLDNYEWSSHGATLDDFLDNFTEEDKFPDSLKDIPFRELVKMSPFQDIFKVWLSERYDACVSDLTRDIPSFPLEINRTILISAGSRTAILDGEFNSVGNFWSVGTSEAYAADVATDQGLYEFTLTALATPDNINWKETLISRMDYTNGDEECEINTTNRPSPKIKRLFDTQLFMELNVHKGPEDNLYMHASYDDLAVGTILRAQQSYEETWGECDFYKKLEKHRPKEMLAQRDSVFLTKSVSALDECGAHESGNMFFVKAQGNVSRHDTNWSSEIAELMAENPKENTLSIARAAKKYWHGIPSETPSWEYKTTSAKIVKSFNMEMNIDFDKSLKHFESKKGPEKEKDLCFN